MKQQAVWTIMALLLTVCGGTAPRSPKTAVGGAAPDFTATRLDGSSFQLSSLRGHVVVLDIWAAWCDGCEKELPVLDDLAARLAPVGATVVSVSIDENPKDALKFLRNRPWRMTAVYDPSGRVGDGYAPAKMPAVFVIDREGVIRDVRFSLKARDLSAIETQVRELSR